MRAITVASAGATPLLFLFAACGGGAETRSAAGRPSASPQHERLGLDLLEGDILKQKPNYVVTDPETGQRFDVRLYTEHHVGHDYEIAVVTTPHGDRHRLANYREYARAMQLVQADLTRRGDRIARVLTTYYSVDAMRWGSSLPEKIKFQERVIADLESELDRLTRQIKAHEMHPDVDSEKMISFWILEMTNPRNGLILQHREARLELERMLYQRMLLEQRAEELSRPARQ
jgi:hypothetical protein